MKKGIITIEFEVFEESDEAVIKRANGIACTLPHLKPIIAEISEQIESNDSTGAFNVEQRLIYNK